MKRTKTSVVLEAVAWSLAGVLLVVTLLYYNVFHKQENTPVYGVGETCPNFVVTTYATGGKSAGTFEPKLSRGKVTVLNFWYKDCSPCVAELPHFNEVQEEYADRVTVVALHSYSINKEDDKQSFLDNTFPDYALTFAQDTEEFKVYNKLGGKNAYPMTVVLDQDGVIRYVRQGGMSKDALVEYIESLL